MNQPSRRTDERAVQGYVIDKVPPQAVELEMAVLGGVLLDSMAINIVYQNLNENDFYVEKHKLIFQAFSELYSTGLPIDMLTTVEQLIKNGNLEKVGGPHYISQLTNTVASTANIEFHSRIIKQKAVKRHVIKLSYQAIAEAYDDTSDHSDLIDNIDLSTQQIRAELENGGTSDKAAIANAVTKEIENTRLTGIAGEQLFGIPELDKLLNGASPGDMIIVAGRPGMGKSMLMNTVVNHAGVNLGKKVLYWGLEMTNEKNFKRLISATGSLDFEAINTGKINTGSAQYENAINQIVNSNIEFVDKVGVNIMDIKSKGVSMKVNSGLDCIIIDWGGLLDHLKNSNGSSTNDRISATSQMVKKMAKELGVPVFFVWQLSREVEKRADKMPILSDLRDSGSLEQDADKIVFIVRHSYYRIEVIDLGDGEGEVSTAGMGLAIVAKNRDGNVGRVKLKFKPHYAKYDRWEDEDFAQDITPIDNMVEASARPENLDDAPF